MMMVEMTMMTTTVVTKTTKEKSRRRRRARRRVPNTTGAWMGNVDVLFCIRDRIARKTDSNEP
jgi:hypothetical protein